jgi:hypothetical protein
VVVRVGAAVVLALAGAATALAAVMVHQRWWGLLLSAAAVGTAWLAMGPGWWTRLPFTLGFAAVLGAAMVPQGEGDYLIAGNGPGYLLLALGFVLVLTSVATLPRPGTSP